jgi:pimeloyl-ACP methyl ester carboxylesterase
VSAKQPTLVLLHPFPMDASFWGPMWRELNADVKLLAPEFPGFGQAPAVEGPSVSGFAGEVAELIRAESGDPSAVVGLSLGGYIALALALEHPDAVGALVLANTRAEADDATGRRAREQAIDTIRIDGLDAYLAGTLPRLLGPSASADAWDRAQAIASGQGPESVCLALEALRDRPDRRGDLGGIRVPTIVVAGADDQVTTLESAQTLVDGIPDAALEVIPAAGHLSALERPAAFAAVVRRALASLPA